MAKKKDKPVRGPANLGEAIKEIIMRAKLGSGMAEEARQELKKRKQKTKETVDKLGGK
jgi:hypothetical protein